MAEDQVQPLGSDLLAGGFSAEAQQASGKIVIRLQGELDLATTAALARELQRALDAHPDAIALDLTDLRFLDSSGVHDIVVGGTRARSQGCGFSLRSPRAHVLRTLQVTGVDQLIPIEILPATTAS